MWHVVGAADGEGKGVGGTSQATHPVPPHPICAALTRCA